jgi:hypothetical protein
VFGVDQQDLVVPGRCLQGEIAGGVQSAGLRQAAPPAEAGGTYDVGGSYIVVDTGFWIFGKKRMLPAGVIDRIDYDRREVHVNLTKDDIRQAPDYNAEREREEAYRQDVGTYYGPYFRS